MNAHNTAQGPVAPPELLERSELFQPRVVDVVPGVRQVIGIGLANATVIEAPDGPIVIDTGSSIDEGARQRAAMFGSDIPNLGALIYSHNHYAKGASVYADATPGLPIWAHEKVHENYVSGRSALLPAYVRRIGTQMGRFLPSEGPDSPPNCGVGGSYDLAPARYGYVRPNCTIVERSTVNIAGKAVELLPAFSDTDCTLTIWFPDEKVAVNNLMWAVFPNIGAIRGEYYRDPLRWISSLDELADLRPEVLLGVHGLPIHGSDEVLQALTDYRDAIQFVYDQTVRGINLGLNPAQIIDSVSLPQHLLRSDYLGQFYGEFPFAIQGVYSGLMGWYGNDPTELKPLPSDESARRYLSLLGGPDALMAAARDALDSGQPQWAAELLFHVLAADPVNEQARGLKAHAFRNLAYSSTSAITRNFYMTAAYELEDRIDLLAESKTLITPEKFRSMGPYDAVSSLRYRVRCLDEQPDVAVAFDFHEFDDVLVAHLRRGVITVSHGSDDSSAHMLRLSFDNFADALASPQNFPDAKSVLGLETESLPRPVSDFFDSLE